MHVRSEGDLTLEGEDGVRITSDLKVDSSSFEVRSEEVLMQGRRLGEGVKLGGEVNLGGTLMMVLTPI